jgi:hypothetical protein
MTYRSRSHANHDPPKSWGAGKQPPVVLQNKIVQMGTFRKHVFLDGCSQAWLINRRARRGPLLFLHSTDDLLRRKQAGRNKDEASEKAAELKRRVNCQYASPTPAGKIYGNARNALLLDNRPEVAQQYRWGTNVPSVLVVEA